VSAIVASVLLCAGLGYAQMWTPPAVPDSQLPTVPKPGSSPTLDRIMKEKMLRVGVGQAPPMQLKDPTTNRWLGVDPVLVERLGEYLKVKVELIDSDWSVIVAGLQAQKYDIVTDIFNTEARRQVVDFTEPYRYGGIAYILLRTRDDLKGVEDLNRTGVTIATATGTGNEQMTQKLLPNAKIKSMVVPSNFTLVQEVVSKRVDAAVQDGSATAALLKIHPELKALPPDVLDAPFNPTPVAWAVRKGDDVFRNFLSQYLLAMKKAGVIEAAFNEYSQVKYFELGGKKF
jgi:ABC-type amino acid transport substrate-binding protein